MSKEGVKQLLMFIWFYENMESIVGYEPQGFDSEGTAGANPPLSAPKLRLDAFFIASMDASAISSIMLDDIFISSLHNHEVRL
jgi:hypothetical protein